MASKKYKITQLQDDDSLLELHPATDADIVSVEKGTGKYQGTASNVQDALEEVYDLATAGSGTVKSVNNQNPDANGNVTLTPANIGAEAAFTDGSGTIASESNGVVTIAGSLTQTNGAVGVSGSVSLGTAAKKTAVTSVSGTPSDSNVLTEKATVTELNKKVNGLASGTTSGDIVTFGANGYTVADSGKSFSTATPSSTSTDNQIPTAKAVYTAISALPTPMQFKGSVGTSGTVTWNDLPPAATANEGYTYKVITDHTADSKCPACKVGDTIVSNGSAWVVIPSGDEPSGTVTSVAASAATGSNLSISGSPITSSGTITIGVASGYSIPSNTDQAAWSAKYDKPSGGIGTSDLASGVVTSLGKADTAYQKPSTGIAKTDLASGVQTSLGKADTAYQKPSGGIGTSDLASGVVTSLGKADTAVQSITATGDATGTAVVSSGAASIALTLKNSGVTAGTYSAVQVNAKGIVTGSANAFEVGSKSGTNTPSANLVVGGIFFEEI